MRTAGWLSVLINFFLVIASVFISLAACELVYRKFEPPEQRMAFLRNQYAFFRYDPVLGWANTPGMSGIFERPDFRTHIRINSDGMRYPEVGPKKKFRVAVLGDSYVWGHGVEREERFTEVIENELGIEMLNFGVSGYGTVQYYLQLDKALSYDPDLVLLVFCLENDFSDSGSNFRYGYYKPYADLDAQGQLQIKGYPVPDRRHFGRQLRPWLAEFALGRAFYSFAGHVLPRWEERPEFDMKAPPKLGLQVSDESIYKRPDSPRAKRAVEINSALLKAMQEKLKERHVAFVVLGAPTLREFGNEPLRELLQNETSRLGIEMISIPGDFPREYFFLRDSHWNRQGHRAVARDAIPKLIKYIGYSP